MIDFAENRGKESFNFDLYWFLDELRAFEKQFSEYLCEQVANNTAYLSKVVNLTEKLECGSNIYVLSFNYTTPFELIKNENSECSLNKNVRIVTNVHGTYTGGDIIFGVDATEILPHDARIFTKTYRKMLHDDHHRSLPWSVNVIKYYGHSLGKSDYSYFQSIFDSYSLYDDRQAVGKNMVGPVCLEFYYTVYDESKRIEIVRNATESVYELITAYGNTLDNKDKGRNLLHKLLLEGRLQIKFLEPLM